MSIDIKAAARALFQDVMEASRYVSPEQRADLRACVARARLNPMPAALICLSSRQADAFMKTTKEVFGSEAPEVTALHVLRARAENFGESNCLISQREQALLHRAWVRFERDTTALRIAAFPRKGATSFLHEETTGGRARASFGA
ncbi:MAG: hypothetical protein IPG34_16600 [Rhodocyclaceae bacterium]|nr:hypothetical protein [Rhodocyclaceae bacterium]